MLLKVHSHELFCLVLNYVCNIWRIVEVKCEEHNKICIFWYIPCFMQ